jgi:hypothetical protein
LPRSDSKAVSETSFSQAGDEAAAKASRLMECHLYLCVEVIEPVMIEPSRRIKDAHSLASKTRAMSLPLGETAPVGLISDLQFAFF